MSSPTNYPGADDSFSVPSSPESIPLSQRGTASLNHTELHAAINAAVIALEANASQLAHDHSGDPTNPLKGAKLLQANTHENVDTDVTTSSIHHTIGPGATQAAPGNHVHDYTGPTITNKPHIICTSTSRPNDPIPGMTIWETDTNAVRAWASFPNNTLESGLGYTDSFSRTSLSVTVDSSGVGAEANSTSLVWEHTVGLGATALLVAFTNFCTSAPGKANWTNSVLYNGIPMTQLGIVDQWPGLAGWLAVYGLLNPPAGSATVAVGSNYGSHTPYMIGSSVSYFNVGSFGTPEVVSSFLGTNPTMNVHSSPGNMVFAAFSGAQAGLSDPSGTQRFYSFPSRSYNSLQIQDTPGVTDTSPDLTKISNDTSALNNCAIALNLVAGAGANLGGDYSQSYVTGSSPADGVMATPVSGQASWIVGANADCRCIARCINPLYEKSITNDQQFEFTTGPRTILGPLEGAYPGAAGAGGTDDFYLRMSADGNAYVRLSLDNTSAAFSYTTTGPSGEQPLGSISAGTIGAPINWQVKATGRTFFLYRNGVQILTAIDADSVTAMDDDHKGWGIGMGAVHTAWGFQVAPPPITVLKVSDLPFYSTEMAWQLLPVGATPVIQMECHVAQEVAPATKVVAYFDMLNEDWFGWITGHQVKVPTPVAPVTDVVIGESGHYDVHASIPWNPAFYGFDHAMLGVTVNGQDIGRNNWEFVRGNGFAPGFAQTQEITFRRYFAAGDVLRLVCQHNSVTVAGLYADQNASNKQVVYLDLKFTSP